MSARAVLHGKRYLCLRSVKKGETQCGSSFVYLSLWINLVFWHSVLQRIEPIAARIFSPASGITRMGVRQQATAAAQVTPLDKLNESPLPIPTPSGSKKDYPAKISGLVEQISGLTLVEVADLTELLKVCSHLHGRKSHFHHDIRIFSSACCDWLIDWLIWIGVNSIGPLIDWLVDWWTDWLIWRLMIICWNSVNFTVEIYVIRGLEFDVIIAFW